MLCRRSADAKSLIFCAFSLFSIDGKFGLFYRAVMKQQKLESDHAFGGLVSLKDTSELLDVSLPTVYALLRAGDLQSVKIGPKLHKVIGNSIRALIARRLAQGPP
jgi:predicted DNA-binding transcriptional regulator AlpA